MADQKQRLIAKFEGKTAVAGVVGLGYVGLPLVVVIAKAGYKVLGVDVNTEVVGGIRYANGVNFDPPTRTLYLSEHLARRVHALGHADQLSADGTATAIPLD